MSVEIFGTEECSEGFRTVAVEGERSFGELWQKAIDELGLRLIGNGVWLYKKDLPDILEEFARVKAYVTRDEGKPREFREKFAEDIDEITRELEARWNEIPDAERLWMG